MKVHFVGIGGASMSVLARILKARGFSVSGSDRVDSDTLRQLETEGISVSPYHAERNVQDADVVVFSGAISRENEELLAARSLGIPVLSRAQLLGWVTRSFPTSVAVAGTHGKTTTCAMLSSILRAANVCLTAHFGGSSALSEELGKDVFLTEACEFQRSLLSLTPSIAVLLNVDFDHADCYRDVAEVQAVFSKFLSSAKDVCIVNGEDARALAAAKGKNCVTFGFSKACDVFATDVLVQGEKTEFFVHTKEGCEKISLPLPGKHNVENALAAIATATLFCVPLATCARALSEFYGVKRRFERVGAFCGASVVCDYAHHPREIERAIAAAKECTSGRVIAVFQPHTFSRTRALMEEFSRCFEGAFCVFFFPTYAAREEFDPHADAKTLWAHVAKLQEAEFVSDFDNLQVALSAKVREGDLILVLGAGDLYDKIPKLFDCAVDGEKLL